MIINQIAKNQRTVRSKNTETKIENSESQKRSLVKTISWRVIGTLDTILISWIITGTMIFAVSIGAVEFFTKMILYFFHERAWNLINYGK